MDISDMSDAGLGTTLILKYNIYISELEKSREQKYSASIYLNWEAWHVSNDFTMYTNSFKRNQFEKYATGRWTPRPI